MKLNNYITYFVKFARLAGLAILSSANGKIGSAFLSPKISPIGRIGRKNFSAPIMPILPNYSKILLLIPIKFT
jgi:hypothetical protein